MRSTLLDIQTLPTAVIPSRIDRSTCASASPRRRCSKSLMWLQGCLNVQVAPVAHAEGPLPVGKLGSLHFDRMLASGERDRGWRIAHELAVDIHLGVWN